MKTVTGTKTGRPARAGPHDKVYAVASATAAIANVLKRFNKTAPERLMETQVSPPLLLRLGTLMAGYTSDNAL